MRCMSQRFLARTSVLLSVLAGPRVLVAQVYPDWFLNQGQVNCEKKAVGYANPSFYRDSSIAQAVRNAAENYGRQTRTQISGGQAFWSTEAGTYWMGADFREQYDTMAARSAPAAVALLDTFVASDIVVVLLGDAACKLDESERRQIHMSGPPPAWSESVPRDPNHYYVVGLAPEYYYETSSWTEAERLGRRNLARTVFVTLKSLQKRDALQGQEIRNEEISATLRHIEVVARWKDREKKIFYVLMRAPKSF